MSIEFHMGLDTNKSLNELLGLGEAPSDTTDSSALVTTCVALYKKPLKDFTVENLRVMIGQNIELDVLIPLALEVLQENPFAEGDYYPGDLLSMVMQVEPSFWKTHQDLYLSVTEIISELQSLMSDLTDRINRFQALSPL